MHWLGVGSCRVEMHIAIPSMEKKTLHERELNSPRVDNVFQE